MTSVLVKIFQEVREYAAIKELEDIEMAIKTAMEEMAAEYNQKRSAALSHAIVSFRELRCRYAHRVYQIKKLERQLFEQNV